MKYAFIFPLAVGLFLLLACDRSTTANDADSIKDNEQADDSLLGDDEVPAFDNEPDVQGPEEKTDDAEDPFEDDANIEPDDAPEPLDDGASLDEEKPDLLTDTEMDDAPLLSEDEASIGEDDLLPDEDGCLCFTVDACCNGCIPINEEGSCTTADLCVATAVCQGGTCVTETFIDCDDDNVCTNDACMPAFGCMYQEKSNGTICSDNDACTIGDRCWDGDCAPIGNIDCNDNNVCTDDACDVQQGCYFTDNTKSCYDNDLCTENDQCAGGDCMPGTPKVCNDNNVCTDDSCSATTGCFFTNNTNPCNDASVCTTNDTCSSGVCKGTAIICNDGNACTDDSCNISIGCIYAIDNTNTCSDGNPATTGDHCVNGMCVGT